MEALAPNETGHRQPHSNDLWSPLNYAIGAGVGHTSRGAGIARYIRDDDSRRLVAYQFLDALAKNIRRYWLPASMWSTGLPRGGNDEKQLTLDDAGPVQAPAQNYREYGDAGNLIDVARSLILGDEQRIRVPDAEPGPTPDDGGEPAAPSGLAKAVQDWVDGWAEKEQLTEKIVEVEDNAICAGDGVTALVWSQRKKRPIVRSYDPGFYFPDWDAGSSRLYRDWGWEDEDYPPVVHTVWEVADPDDPERVWVERSTWSLRPTGRPVKRRYQTDPVEWTCWFEKTWFDLETDGDLYSWSSSSKGARVVQEPTDLQIDFIPVVHVPNTPPGSKLWGRSLLMSVVQLLDDVATGSTDLAVNAETVAGGTIISQGATEQPPDAPGWWSFMQGGGAQVLDTSHVLDALIKHLERMEKKLALNTRLGEILLGLVAANEVPSGYAMRLGFSGPAALEREFTAVRTKRYALLAKMAVRMAQQAGVLPAGDTPQILFILGKGLPVDRAAAIAEVRDLLAPPAAISIVTAVRMLQEAGIPIEDAEKEVERIRAENLDDAIKLVQATGDVPETRKRLGLDPNGGPDLTPVAQPGDAQTGAGDSTGSAGDGSTPGGRDVAGRGAPAPQNRPRPIHAACTVRGDGP
jgi:hypothetical protein